MPVARHTTPPSAPRASAAIVLALLALSGCTFGVDAVELRAEDSVEATGISRVRADLSHVGDLRVTGREQDVVHAALVTRALLASGEAEAARESMEVEVYVEEDVAGVWASTFGPYAELLEPARLELELPSAMGVQLTLGSTSAHVSHVRGLVEIRGASGSVVLEGGDALDIELESGSIVAEARAAILRTRSGSMEITVAEHVDAEARSGSIHARLRGGGGDLHTDSGSIVITLEAPLTEDLEVSANSGSVQVELPTGIGARLDLDAGDGSVSVDAGGRDFGGESFIGDVGGGGHTIRVRTGDGSIAVDTAGEGR